MTMDEKIELFFKNPIWQPQGQTQGVLYLLRREIQDCLIGKVVPEHMVVAEAVKERHRLFATVMLIAAGVDLLAKFYKGSDEPGGVRSRMEEFTMRYMFASMPDPKKYADVFYFGCRNPMLHSFSMFNERFTMTLVSGKPMHNGAIWHVPAEPNRFVISVEGLFACFIAAVEAYRAQLVGDPGLRQNFDKMFENYGSIPMFTAVVQPYNPAASVSGAP